MLFKKKNQQEKRRYQRLSIHDPALIPVELHWEGGETLAVFDLSHKGAAVAEPNAEAQQGDLLDVDMQVGPDKIGPLTVRVAWKKKGVWGLEFHRITGSARLTLNSFLEHKLIGANLKAVDRRYFSPDLDCQHWFHGPSETDLFLWMMSNGESEWIARAIFELPELRVIYNKGSWTREEKRAREFDDELTPLPARQPTQPLRERLIDLLTQLTVTVSGVRELIDKLKNTRAFDV